MPSGRDGPEEQAVKNELAMMNVRCGFIRWSSWVEDASPSGRQGEAVDAAITPARADCRVVRIGSTHLDQADAWRASGFVERGYPAFDGAAGEARTEPARPRVSDPR